MTYHMRRTAAPQQPLPDPSHPFSHFPSSPLSCSFPPWPLSGPPLPQTPRFLPDLFVLQFPLLLPLPPAHGGHRQQRVSSSTKPPPTQNSCEFFAFGPLHHPQGALVDPRALPSSRPSPPLPAPSHPRPSLPLTIPTVPSTSSAATFMKGSTQRPRGRPGGAQGGGGDQRPAYSGMRSQHAGKR